MANMGRDVGRVDQEASEDNQYRHDLADLMDKVESAAARVNVSLEVWAHARYLCGAATGGLPHHILATARWEICCRELTSQAVLRLEHAEHMADTLRWSWQRVLDRRVNPQ